MGHKQQLKMLTPYDMVIAGGMEESVSSLDTDSMRSNLDSSHSRLSNLTDFSFGQELSRWGATPKEMTNDPRASYGFTTSATSAVVALSPRQASRRWGTANTRTTSMRSTTSSSDGSADVTSDRWGNGSSKDSTVKMPSQGLNASTKPKFPQRKNSKPLGKKEDRKKAVMSIMTTDKRDERSEEGSTSSIDSSNKRFTRRSLAAETKKDRAHYKIPTDGGRHGSERAAPNELSVTVHSSTATCRRRSVDPTARRRRRKGDEGDLVTQSEHTKTTTKRRSRRKNPVASRKQSTERQSSESSLLDPNSQRDRPRQPRPMRRTAGSGDGDL